MQDDNNNDKDDQQQVASQVTNSGFVAIVGQPNVGKSTLLNALLGKRVAITTRKPQTTRHNLSGVLTDGDTQIVFIDTPGIHQGYQKAINRYMNKVARDSLVEVNVIIFIISGLRWDEADDAILNLIKQRQGDAKVFLLINKVDLVKEKDLLLPFIAAREDDFIFDAIIPISAKKELQLDVLKKKIIDEMPAGPQYYPAEQTTNRDDGFLVSELLREQLILQLGQEMPYVTAVTIDSLKKEKGVQRVIATIWVCKESQKPIIIGKNGASLKRIATSARLSMQDYFKSKVYLNVWVKVKNNWIEDSRSMQQLGYDDE